MAKNYLFVLDPQNTNKVSIVNNLKIFDKQFK